MPNSSAVSSNSGFMGNVHAKIFEIILLICFSVSTIFIIINFILTTWLFKCSYSLLIIEILILIFNIVCIVLSILLRVFRSNNSVFDSN